MTKDILLVVEDNLTLLEGLREILKREGFSVLTACNGVEALDKLGEVSPDLILADILMPEMDGYGLLSAVRDDPKWVSVPFIFLTAKADQESLLKAKKLGVEDYLLKPFTRSELVAVLHARLERARQVRSGQTRLTYDPGIIAMANAANQRDPYTKGRLERVTANTLALAELLGLEENRKDQLRYGSILYDIGRLHIRESILIKPGPLDDEEWKEVKFHPVAGAEMIRNIPSLAPAVPAVRHHHERWDGQGYPDGLSGEAIPLEARIVAVTDAYDAMTSPRAYRPALSPEQANQEVQRGAGVQYDPWVVAAFEQAWEAGQLKVG